MPDRLPPAPVGPAEFAACLDPLAPAGAMAVAVSGGSDSVALLRLARRWAHAARRTLLAVTVDHGLRPESAGEVHFVAKLCEALGVEHCPLRWEGHKPSANLQAAARGARYRLMADWARERGIAALLLAHTLDDLAETFLLRLGRGSGVDGLSAMASRADVFGVPVLRPLLGVSRLRLRATLVSRGVRWVEDASNTNARFARVRMRALMPALAAEGLDAGRLAGTARRLARARQALETATSALLAQAAELDAAGFIRLRLGPWASAPEEIGLRALARALKTVGAQPLPLRLERLERLYGDLVAGPRRGRTLAGCRILPSLAGDHVLIAREPAKLVAAPQDLAPGARALWDGRFVIALSDEAPGGGTVAALGGHRLDRHRGDAVPAPVRPSLPGFWLGGELAAVPHLSWWRAGFPKHAFQAVFRGFSD